MSFICRQRLRMALAPPAGTASIRCGRPRFDARETVDFRWPRRLRGIPPFASDSRDMHE